MRMFTYYAVHSVKNQIRKLFHTWVAVFLLICVLLGVAVGVGSAVLMDSLDDAPASDSTVAEDVLPDDYAEEVVMGALSAMDIVPLAELATAAVTLLMLLWNVLSADKSGGQIFPMADVNLLFPSPLKPQTVLLFRLLSQLGSLLVASLIFLFQIPTLTDSGWITLPGTLLLILSWFFLLAYAKLLNVLLYTVCSTHTPLKRWLRPVAFGVVGLLLATYLFYLRQNNAAPLAAAVAVFNAPWTRAIPVYGWMKGLVVTALKAHWLAAGGYALLLSGALIALVWFIWRLRADFYEDALQRAEKADETRRAAAESATGVATTRHKARPDRQRRDTFSHGCGANVYFYKAMHNRFRFAQGRLLTKTAAFYLLLTVAVCALLHFGWGTSSLTVVALVLSGCCFFRSLGNPLNADTTQASFRMIPESAHAKVFFSLMGGSLNCVLDLLPAFVVAVVWMRGNPLTAIAWLLFAAAIDFYASNVGLFLDLSIPTRAGKTVKQLIQILFIYFGLLPTAALILFGYLVSAVPLFVALAAVFHAGVGFAFFGISPLFLQNGQS